eukprot:CAMPEP_0201569166 /NCGR_PEP_ID=MMETSP0190_2-20130828/10694_1 /ASSEMBLY_ACC=CAM_ASM_000263 /TAXON_ID=37353 /ORGANISM="Rosalina sp." /LENGTH=650 /DNA_ID=CAMNT_0047991179 /DNA_START=49 /DNA_END=2001 /DNA_ORIENTATION=-
MALVAVGVTIIVAILLLISNVNASSNKQCYGPDYSEIMPFYGIPTDVCTHAYYDPSVGKSLTITLTYGQTLIGTENFSDEDPAYDEKEICDPAFPAPYEFLHACNICLGFDDIFLSDDWARICPKYILSCKNPLGYKVKKEFPTPCFTVGDEDRDDLNVIVGGNTDFSFKLLSSNALTNDIVTDLFVSPFSITNALVMTMMAANGDTLEQLLNVFELTSDDYDIFDTYATLVESLQHDHYLFDVISNDLWINNVWYKVISPSYLKDFDRFGDINSCDFKNNSYLETMKIDNKVEDTTNNLIAHPLENKNLSSSTVMLYTNTIYFKGNWENEFIENRTETFTDDNKDEKVTIKMMLTDKFNVTKYNDSEVEVIELPFDDDFSDFSFIMIRPTQEKYLKDGPSSTIQFEEKLNRVLLDKWLDSLETAGSPEKIALPFLEMYNCQDITDSLKTLGITDVFDPHKADLTNLTIPHYQVYETDFNRQDYMKITNKGIEIASFVTDGDNGKDDTNQGKVQHADLPFLFLIMDRSINLILFAGRVTNPKGWVIYKGDNNNDGGHAHVGTIIMSLLAVIIISYCIIKYAYNRTVMQLKGVDAIPHIEQCRSCKTFCAEKIDDIRERGSSGNVNDDSGVGDIIADQSQRYKQLINNDQL